MKYDIIFFGYMKFDIWPFLKYKKKKIRIKMPLLG